MIKVTEARVVDMTEDYDNPKRCYQVQGTAESRQGKVVLRIDFGDPIQAKICKLILSVGGCKIFVGK